MLDKIRFIQEGKSPVKQMLTEEEDKNEAIAITDDPRFGQNALTNQIQQFRSSVEGGAEFTKVEDIKDISEAPLIYMPRTNNLVFSGVIPCLNNLKWQFVLKTNTGNGCFIWSDGMILSKENLAILNKLYGFYNNWKESWQIEASDLERMAAHLKD